MRPATLLCLTALLAASASAQDAPIRDRPEDAVDVVEQRLSQLPEITQAVGRQSSLRGRFSYLCLADLYRELAERTTDPAIRTASLRAATQYERAVPSEEIYELAGFSTGQTVTASLGEFGTCTTILRSGQTD